MYDLLIKDARIHDGLGAEPASGDVAVAGGRIVDIGRISAVAAETVDAQGLALMPGIVDVHTHYDAQLTWEPTASPSPALGVTTVVVGNCGFGIAPCPAEAREAVVRNLSEVEGMPLEVLEGGIDWSFTTFADYLALLRRKGTTPNVGVFAGHSTIRSVVMGPAASERAATAEEIARMRAEVAAALAAGAIGFASSQSLNHMGYGGVPMPSRLAEEAETRALVGVLGAAAKGLFQITVGPATTVASLEQLARDTRRPVVFSALFHNDAYPERAPSMLAQCNQARARGAEVYAQVGCQPLSMDFTLANAYPFQSLDIWAPLRAAAPEAIARAIADPDFRARFRAAIGARRKGTLFYGDWHRVEIAEAATGANAALEGLDLAEVAARQRKDPLDAFFDLALAEELRTVFNARLLNTDEEVVAGLLRDPSSLVSLSDAGAHLTYLCDAGYGLHLLGHWTRARATFTLPEAVRELTSRPADLYGIAGRGRIAPGAQADLLLFDPDTVEVSRPRRVFDLPGGSGRLVRDGIGVHGVWVNGAQVFDGSDYVAQQRPPGTVLDRFGP